MKYIQYDPAEFAKITVEKADDVDALKARIAELTAALKPFASLLNEEGDYIVASPSLSDLRAARAAYLGEKE